MTASRLAHYEILEKIGQGGMGVVFKAHDTRLERTVALKILPALASSDDERRHRFLREAKAEARVNHPGIATIYEIGEAVIDDPELAPPTGERSGPGKVPYLAMEYIEGRDLQELVTGADRPSPKRVLSYAIQIAEALAAAHAQGVVHRDLKPHNIRVTPENRIKLLDFGLAKLLTLKDPDGLVRPTGQTFLTTEGMIVGTIPYIAPEQIEGTESDPRSDLFAFGVVLYQLATGKLPFASNSLVSYVRSVTDDKPRRVTTANAALDPALDSLVARLLEPKPEDRFQSAAELAAELKQIARGDLPTAPLAWRPGRGALRSWSLPAKVAAAGVALAAMGAIAWLAVSPRPAAEPGVATVAMLPFENRTGDAAHDPTGTALQSLVGDRVARLAALVDARRTASLAAEGLSDVEIARSVGADYSLRGELQTLDQAPVFQVHLTEAASALQLWRLSFERFDLREEILWTIDSYLRVLFSPHQARRRAREPAAAARALNLYFAARQRLDLRGEREDLLAIVEAFREVTRADPESPAAWTGRSAAAWQLYQFTRESEALAEAERAAARALEIEPGHAGARIARARVARARDSVDTSIAQLEALLGEEGLSELDRAEAYYQLSIGHDQNREADEAVRYLELALGMRPEFWRWWHQLGTYELHQNRFDQAFKALRRSIDLAPSGVTQPRHTLVPASIYSGNRKAALEQCETLSEAGPITNEVTLSNCGTAYFFEGDCELSAQYFARTVAQLPQRATGWANLGDARQCLEDDAGAMEAYGRAVEVLETKRELETLHLSERDRLPLYLAKAGRCEGEEGAVDAAIGLLEIDPDSPEPARLAAQTLALCGERRRALDAVARAIELGVPPSTLRDAAEFADLAGDPEFVRLVGPSDG